MSVIITMQAKTTEVDINQIKIKLGNALAKIERSISMQNKKIANQEKIRTQVVAELDTYIANLEILLNPEKK